MEVVKPEVYWIGNRCYRVNPSRYNDQGKQISKPENYYEDSTTVVASNKNRSTYSNQANKPYVEVDDYDGGQDTEMGDDEENFKTSMDATIVSDDNGFKAVCSIPSSLFSHLIGAKGSVKKRIEGETHTRIYVPRQNEKGDVFVRGHTEREVSKAYKRLEQIARNARFRRDATHFLGFAMNEAAVCQKAEEFQKKVLSDCGQNSRGLDPGIFQDPRKLHLTICVLVLLDERERLRASEMLKDLQPEVRKLCSGESIKVHLKGLEVMNDDPSQVDILYAKCNILTNNSDRLQRVADLISAKFVEGGLGKESRGGNVKLHCTLINTRFRNTEIVDAPDSRVKNGNNMHRERESFDARMLLQKYGDFDFGIIDVAEVKIATRFTTGTDGFYKCYAAITLPE